MQTYSSIAYVPLGPARQPRQNNNKQFPHSRSQMPTANYVIIAGFLSIREWSVFEARLKIERVGEKEMGITFFSPHFFQISTNKHDCGKRKMRQTIELIDFLGNRRCAGWECLRGSIARAQYMWRGTSTCYGSIQLVTIHYLIFTYSLLQAFCRKKNENNNKNRADVWPKAAEPMQKEANIVCSRWTPNCVKSHLTRDIKSSRNV